MEGVVGTALDATDAKGKALEPLREKIFGVPSLNSTNLASYLGNLAISFRQKLESVEGDAECVRYLHASLAIGFTEQPHQISSYSTLVALLKGSNLTFVQGYVNFLVKELQSRLDAFHWRESRILLQGLMDLSSVGVVALESAMQLLQSLYNVVNEVGPPNFERKDCFVGLLLATLPWISRSLSESGLNSQLEAMVSSIHAYLSGEARLEYYRSHESRMVRAPFKVLNDTNGLPYAQVPLVEAMALQMVNWMEAKKWPVPVAYQQLPDLKLESESAPAGCGTVLLPLERPGVTVYAFSEIPTRVIPTDADDRFERMIASTFFSDMIILYAHNSEVCSERLFEFAKLLTLENVEPFELLVDTIFSEMLRLPSAVHKPVYYHSLIVHLVKLAIAEKVAAIPKALGKAFRTVWSYLESSAEFDIELQRRFAVFFAHYLSNYNFKWNWAEWLSVATPENLLTNQLIVLREVLELCCRFSSKDTVAQALGAEGKQILESPAVGLGRFGESQLPAFSDNDAELDIKVSNLRKANENLVYNERLKKVPYEAYEAYNTAFSSLKEYLTPDRQDLLPAVAVAVLAESGKLSLGQVLTFIEKLGAQIKPMMKSDSAKESVLDYLYATLENNTELFEFVIDKFINYRLIDLPFLVDWLFKPTSMISKSITRYFLWDIVRTNVHKLVWRKALLQAQLKKAQVELADFQRANPDVEPDNAEHLKLTEAQAKVEMQYTKLSQDLKSTLFNLFKNMVNLLDVYAHAPSAADKNIQQSWKMVSGYVIEFARYFQSELRPQRTTLSLIFTKERHESVSILWSQVDNYLKAKV